MNTEEKLALIERHLKAEGAGDVDGACSVYADSVVHDPVGFPGAPYFGIEGARAFYTHLTANIRTTGEETLHQYVTDTGSIVAEASMTADVIGEFLGIQGHGRSVTFRILHVFDFDDELITREQVWLDTGAIVAQLSAPAAGN